MRFIELGQDLLRIDTINPPSSEREPLHIHPKQESGAELVSRSLVFELDGVLQRVRSGESIAIPTGAPHRFWTEGEQDAHSIQFFQPGLRSADFFEELFALARQGELDDRGMPRPMALLALASRFGDEIRPVSPPWPLVRGLAILAGPLARRRHPPAVSR